MRVLVTGAAGFLGNAVTAALVRHGHEPVAFVRGGRRVPRGAVAAFCGDVLDPAADRAAAGVAATGALGAVSLRACNIAGAAAGVTDTDVTRLIPKILAVQAGLETELVVNGDGSVVRDFVHVLDMAEAFALALDACVPGQWRPYNVGSGRRARVLDVLRTAEQVTGHRVPVRHRPPAKELPAAPRPPDRSAGPLPVLPPPWGGVRVAVAPLPRTRQGESVPAPAR